MARQFIVPWKIERELHRTYGGRVIFQQAGPEALDARMTSFAETIKSNLCAHNKLAGCDNKLSGQAPAPAGAAAAPQPGCGG